ncbi:tyrosine-type recombinase/integrase [Nitrospira sp. Nam74]
MEQARVRWLGAPPCNQEHTIGELLQEYQAKVTPQKAPDSRRRDLGVLKRFSHEWGDLLLGELSPKTIEDHIADRLEEVTFATVSKELGIVKAAYHRAIRWGWALRNPFAEIPLNQQGQERLRWLQDDEERALLGVCAPYLQDLTIVGVDTGLRRGNLVGLQREWVHNSSQLLIIPRPCTKTKKMTLTIPLTDRASAIISRRLNTSKSAYVFVQEDGTPYSPNKIGMDFYRATTSAGLVDVCLYTLRHTFISRLVQSGRPLPEVAALAGHKDIRMTMRYAHLAPNHLREGIKALESRIQRVHHSTEPGVLPLVA